MQTKTFTLLITITAEPGHTAFDTSALADVVQGALETGTKCVVKGVPDVKVPAVASASVDAFRGDFLAPPHGSDMQRAKILHHELREGA